MSRLPRGGILRTPRWTENPKSFVEARGPLQRSCPEDGTKELSDGTAPRAYAYEDDPCIQLATMRQNYLKLQQIPELYLLVNSAQMAHLDNRHCTGVYNEDRA